MKAIKQRAALLKAQGVDSQAALLKIADGNVDVIQEWSKPLTKEEKAERKALIFDLWLAGGTTHEIAEKLVIRQNAVFESIQLTRQSALKHLVSDEPPVYNVWNFNQCDPRFGQKHPGQIPGQTERGQ